MRSIAGGRRATGVREVDGKRRGEAWLVDDDSRGLSQEPSRGDEGHLGSEWFAGATRGPRLNHRRARALTVARLAINSQ